MFRVREIVPQRLPTDRSFVTCVTQGLDLSHLAFPDPRGTIFGRDNIEIAFILKER